MAVKAIGRISSAAAVLLSVPFLVLTFPSPVPGAEKGLKIEGFIGQSTTVPAGNYTVKLLDGGTGKVLDIVETNFFGKYKFEDLPPGHYVVQAGDVKREVMLKAKDGKKRLDIDLSAKGGAMDYSKSAQAVPAPEGGAATPAGPNDPDLMRQMAARYYGYSGSTETKVALCPNGAYYEASESSYSGQSSDSLGNQTMAWGAAGAGSKKGAWTVQGSLQQGTITVTYASGNVTRIKYVQGPEAGCYSFNGTTVCRSGPADCQ